MNGDDRSADSDRGLLLHLAGPLQAWGGAAPFGTRGTLPHPTRSALIGLLACALGRPRTAAFTDLDQLLFAVRIDEPGTLLRDFHTVGGGGRKVRKTTGAVGEHAVVGDRYYLSGAAFTVAVTGPGDVLEQVANALSAPVWPVFLGRRACAPTVPLLLGWVSNPAGVLRTAPLVARAARTSADIVWDAGFPGAEGVAGTLPDQPVSFAPLTRAHRTRMVRREHRPGFTSLGGLAGVAALLATVDVQSPAVAGTTFGGS